MGRYNANFNYFDNIDTPNKAYWLGFIWSDGYIAKRIRNNNKRIEYNLKLALKDSDSGHLEKLARDLDSNYPVHFYKSCGFIRTEEYLESRLFITNVHMCGKLYEEYGIIPNRCDPSKIISATPNGLHRYLILGFMDADGSFTSYSGIYGDKMNVSFGGSYELLKFIESHLVENEIVEDTNRKVNVRHEGKDGTWRTISFPGIPQASKVLNYLYRDSIIHLDRKYEKYLSLNLREDKITKWSKK